ncbi:MAG: TonB-dependent receptor, partial [Alistipes sp.]|nr:TonB-dependent receptor [Alistipes sp.]
DDTHFFAGIEVEYRPVAGLDITLGFNANTDSGNSPYLYSDPKLTADLKVQYTLKRWKFYASGAMLGARKFSGVIGEDGKAPIAFEVGTKFDVGAGLSYRISRDFEVYADGINLLNSRLYDFAHYYRNGAGFKAGVKIHF